jgi:hypothetical protein
VARNFREQVLLITIGMRSRITLLAGILALACGCARFEHQTAATEPHAVLRISPPPTESDLERRLIKRVDGLPVRAGNDYRVRPGTHQMVVQVLERFSQTYRPYSAGGQTDGTASLNINERGGVSAIEGNPFGGTEMVNINVDARRVYFITNTIVAEAGWRYDCDGYDIRKKRITP